MAETLDLRKLELLQNFQCVICLDGVNEARLCPHCTHLFCDKCIHNWITTKSSSCPNCRASVQYSALVKGYSINQIQESIKQLFFSMDLLLCDKHENQHLSLFCYCCEVNICVKCWFSVEHAEHKERAVPLEEAFEHYKQNMTATLIWINGRKKEVDQVLSQVQENERRLSKESELIEKLVEESKELIAGKADPTTLIKILKTDRAMTELRSNHQDETASIRLDRRRDFMSEPTLLVFRMTEFDKTIKSKGSYETNLQAPYGFEWECNIKDEGGEDLSSYLSLVKGKPSEYSVLFANEPEKVHRFELDSAVNIGAYKRTAQVDNVNSQELTVQIRQSYADKFQQLQDYITRLENDNAQHVAFKTYLADWEKRIGPSSG